MIGTCNEGFCHRYRGGKVLNSLNISTGIGHKVLYSGKELLPVRTY